MGRSQDYAARMGTQLKKALWENVRALMVERYGEENLNRLSREAKMSKGTIARIKDGETSVGLDLVAHLARYFKVPPELLISHVQDKRLLTIAKAFTVTDERGREFLIDTSLALIRKSESGSKDSEAI